MAAAGVYRGTFGRAQAERLLWRAGFGPRRGEAEALAALGLEAAVRSLTRPPRERLEGPAPRDAKGRPLAPADAWGHDHVWWLDRMVRTNRPLVERMTLVWHDWFATSLDGVGSQRLMLRQNALLRRHALGSFPALLREITRDPAMLLWLSGTENTKWSPNENYARELMELFTLGAGRGYTERDVREQARALTGFRNSWRRGVGPHHFRFDRDRHDGGTKRIFGRSGRYDWEDAVRLCLRHPRHPTFLVEKLWGYFVPGRPPAATRRSLEAVYRKDGRIRPVVERILQHPALYTGPRMVKPPVVYTAGLLRAVGRPLDTTDWSWLAPMTGQRLFLPPNVAGWDDKRWLDTGTFRGRWWIATTAAKAAVLGDKDAGSVPSEPERLVEL
ncbi:MAG TPA: DUF1800 domain-containing protein, partial [Gaiellaceae bacterium]|nr:DUF1800 domain-containing protein [Gaiellaceae bacterium]